MEEARRVLERLDRIEALNLGGAPTATVLDELRELVSDAESWLAAEGPGVEAAAHAVARCRTALDASPLTVSA